MAEYIINEIHSNEHDEFVMRNADESRTVWLWAKSDDLTPEAYLCLEIEGEGLECFLSIKALEHLQSKLPNIIAELKRREAEQA